MIGGPYAGRAQSNNPRQRQERRAARSTIEMFDASWFCLIKMLLEFTDQTKRPSLGDVNMGRIPKSSVLRIFLRRGVIVEMEVVARNY